MDVTETLTIIALVLNAFALIAVSYQIHQSKKSIELATQSTDLARKSVDHQRRMVQLELLPNAHSLFAAQNDVENWLQKLEHAILHLHEALEKKDKNLISSRINMLKSPKGLIDRYDYEFSPDWLKYLWMAGAQHYYAFHLFLQSLSQVDIEEVYWNVVPTATETAKERIAYLEDIMGYINDMVPDAYADSPAGIDDDAFLSHPLDP
jgi:hypothetical protein